MGWQVLCPALKWARKSETAAAPHLLHAPLSPSLTPWLQIAFLTLSSYKEAI